MIPDVTAYDGVRALWNGRELTTRNGTVITAPFVHLLPRGVPLDGELWAGTNGFADAQAAAQGEPGDAVWNKITYVVFDLIEKHTTLRTRYRKLHLLRLPPPVRLVVWHEVRDHLEQR